MKKIEVFDGVGLSDMPPVINVNDPKCAFIGKTRSGADVQVPLDFDILSKHIMLLGGIGTGKTTAFFQLIRQLNHTVTPDDVMVIFDTKGDFYREFYREGDIVISNDSTATGENGIDYWNIFNEIECDEQMEENVTEIARSIFHEKTEKTNQPFFPNAARDIFAALLTHFCRNKHLYDADNNELRKLLDRSDAKEIKSILAQHDDLKAISSYIENEVSAQTQGVLSELQQTMREIFIGNFRKKGTLSMRNLIRAKGGKKIFIEYDLGIGSMLSPIYSLLFDLAIKEALCRKKSQGNVYFIADEFRLLPNLQHVDDAVNFGRSLGVKFMIGIQNVEQVYEVYGEERARSIMSGFLTNISFRVNDYCSKDYIKNFYGQNRKKEIYMASVQGRGIMEEVRDAFVIEDWDIATLDVGEAVIGLPGKAPFILKFAYR